MPTPSKSNATREIRSVSEFIKRYVARGAQLDERESTPLGLASVVSAAEFRQANSPSRRKPKQRA